MVVDHYRFGQAELRLQQKHESALDLVELIAPRFRSRNFSIPKLQFFEGRANVESMLYDNCREWQRSISYVDYVWWGYQDHSVLQSAPWR